jgi:prolyl oligopeptidase
MDLPPVPETRRDDVVDVLHGVEVADPYRWLEDGEDPDVRTWTTAQNDRTRAVLDALPGRKRLRDRLAALLGVRMVGGVAVAGDRLFTIERGGGLDQAALFVRDAGGDPADEPRLLFDPQRFHGEETAALDWYHPSRDGRLVALGTSLGGDERSRLRVLDVETGSMLADEIPHTRAASVGWLPDSSAFAYTRYPDPDTVAPEESGYHRTVWWHELGTDPAADTVVYDELPDPTAWPEVSVSKDGRWLLLHVALGWDRIDVHLVDRTTGARTTVIEGVDAVTAFEVVGDRLLGTTTLDAPRGRVVEAALDDPASTNWRTLVHEGRSVIEGISVTDRSMLVRSTRSAVSRLDHDDLHGGEHRDVALPAKATVVSMDGSDTRDEAWVALTSFAGPPRLHRWTPEHLDPWGADDPTIDPDAYVVEQVRYPSTDGTEVGLLMLRRADTVPGPDVPTILTGYGGFNITMSPEYNAVAVAHCDAGGAFVVAGLRGGAEEGEEWHQAGMRANKQQVFDDFAAAADWLVAEGRTSRARLAIRGGSNGGLLVAATLTQRPDLCRAVHCAVPLTDMIRFPRFLIAKLWVPEYGDPEQPEDFAWLYAYSPYHRVVDGTCYPALLVTTGEGDSRVDAGHARKFAAAVQHATCCAVDHPVVVRDAHQAGHGLGMPVGRQADEAADVLAFLHWQLDV